VLLLKICNSKTLFKKGNKNYISHNRPTSVLTLFSKIFEKVMQNRLLKHLTDHNVLRREQYGLGTELKTDNSTYK